MIRNHTLREYSLFFLLYSISHSVYSSEYIHNNKQTKTGVFKPDVSATSSPDCTISTSKLGWIAGSDVTKELIELMADRNENDVVCFDALYDFRDAATNIPKGVTLYAAAGAGLRAISVATSSQPYLKLSSNVKLQNFTITDEGPLTSEDNRESNNKTIVIASDASDITIINSLIEGHAKTLFRIQNVDRLRILSTHFRLGFYQILVGAGSDDLLVKDSLFSESQRDGIKTLRGPEGINDPRVLSSAFENQIDGIDTTGGFRNGIVSGCLFRNLFAGLDIKAIFERESDLDLNVGYNNILITDSQFINARSAVVLTTIDRGQISASGPLLNDLNVALRMPHNIELKNLIIEDGIQGLLIKDAHDVTWHNIQLLGGVKEKRIFSSRRYPIRTADRFRPIISRTNYNLKGTKVSIGPVRDNIQPYPFSLVGPR